MQTKCVLMQALIHLLMIGDFTISVTLCLKTARNVQQCHLRSKVCNFMIKCSFHSDSPFVRVSRSV